MPVSKGLFSRDQPVDHGIDGIADLAHTESLAQLPQLKDLRKKSLSEVTRKSAVSDIELRFKDLVLTLDRSRVEPQYEAIWPDKAQKLYESQDLVRPGDFRGRSIKHRRRPFSIDTSGEYSRLVHSIAFRRLQGKMQLFPPTDSPLLRNRLTHSLEVADISSNIVSILNQKSKRAGHKLDPAIVATAALAHDLGHPPFGHSGEIALNRFMSGWGGFEGNAQSLRIVSRLENRFVDEFPRDRPHTIIYKDPLGLNFLMRTLAALLKYDRAIPIREDSEQPQKGYYAEDHHIVDCIKAHVIRNPSRFVGPLYTIECQIMDLADDIAYSTYDLEDCLISGLTTPIEMMASDARLTGFIKNSVNKNLKKRHYGYEISETDVSNIFYKLFDSIIRFSKNSEYDLTSMIDRTSYISYTYRESKLFATNSLYRRRLTETLIGNAINAMSISWNEEEPALSRLKISTEFLLYIEVLRAYNYFAVIKSQKLQIYQERANNIVTTLCETLMNDTRDSMLPENARTNLEHYLENDDIFFDYKTRGFKPLEAEDLLPRNIRNQYRRRRFICDFVSSLTDSEAISMYKNMKTADPTYIVGM